MILDVLVTPAEVTENLPMLELLFRSTFRWRLHPRSVTGDAAYGTRENIAAIEKAGIRAYTGAGTTTKNASPLPQDDFVYDAERTSTSAPRRDLAPSRPRPQRRGTSGTLPSPPPATSAPSRAEVHQEQKKGRWIRRSLEEEYLERVRAYRDTEPYRKAPKETRECGSSPVRGGQGVSNT